MPAMIDWLRSTPLSCLPPASRRISANASTVNASSSGSGPSRSMPSIVDGSRVTYTASRFCVPASVRSKPPAATPSSSTKTTRNASGPLPGLGGTADTSSRQCSQPARARCVTRWMHLAVLVDEREVEELAAARGVEEARADERGHRRVERLQRADRRELDARHAQAFAVRAEVRRQRLDLGQLGHGVEPATAVHPRRWLATSPRRTPGVYPAGGCPAARRDAHWCT